jgi:glycosyltransferase involved in cell wall biosynthesis
VRFLCVVPKYPPASRVGAWLTTHRFLARLSSSHPVEVVAYLTPGRGYDLDGVAVHPRNWRPTEADIVIAHLGDNGAGRMWADRLSAPLVYMVHGPQPDLDKLADADLTVFNSESLRDRCGHTGRSIVCHPPTFPAEHQVAETGDAVTLVNCTREKGVKTLGAVAERMTDRRFLAVKGGYGHQVDLRAPNVTTWPTQHDMRPVWAATRVLCVPSEEETWGLVGVEAMCSGIPVIAHPTPGLVESLGSAGVFVDRHDIGGWVAAIETLHDPDNYKNASVAALDRAAELDPEPSLARFVDAVEALA